MVGHVPADVPGDARGERAPEKAERQLPLRRPEVLDRVDAEKRKARRGRNAAHKRDCEHRAKRTVDLRSEDETEKVAHEPRLAQVASAEAKARSWRRCR